MKKRYTSEKIKDTHKIAEDVIRFLNSNKSEKQAGIVILQGNLGTGKTEFVKGAAKFLKIEKNILSPTFVLMRNYDIRTGDFKKLYHFDCYRLLPMLETNLLDLGIEEILNDSKNLVFIEWGKGVKMIKKYIHLIIDFKMKGDKREIEVRTLKACK